MKKKISAAHFAKLNFPEKKKTLDLIYCVWQNHKSSVNVILIWSEFSGVGFQLNIENILLKNTNWIGRA